MKLEGTFWVYGSMKTTWVVLEVKPGKKADIAVLATVGGAMTQRVGVPLLTNPVSGWRRA